MMGSLRDKGKYDTVELCSCKILVGVCEYWAVRAVDPGLAVQILDSSWQEVTDELENDI
jgi:hypothetical protein